MAWPLQRLASDEEPLYDTLRPPNQKLLMPKDYSRVRCNPSRVTRESVVEFADNLMEKGIEHSISASPEPVDHTIEAYSSMVQMQIATSSNVADSSKPYMAQPLSARKSRHSRAESEPRNFSNAEADGPSTPVHVSALRAIFSQPSTAGQRQATMSVVSHSSPHSPVGTTAATSADELSADNKDEEPGFERTNSTRGKAKLRPTSWDSSLLFQGGDAKGHEDDLVFGGSNDPFSRDSNLRTPIRRNKLGSSRGDLTDEKAFSFDGDYSFDKDEPPASPSVVDSSPSSSLKMPTEDAKHPLTKKLSKPIVSVRERTKKWEERGSTGPIASGSSSQAHLATLPRPVKKRASTSNIPVSSTTTQCTSGIPISIKSPSPVSSLQSAVKKVQPLVDSSVSTSEINTVSNVQEQQQPVAKGADETSGGVPQRKDGSLPQIRSVGDVSSVHSPKSLASSSKLRGSLLPTKTPIPVSYSWLAMVKKALLLSRSHNMDTLCTCFMRIRSAPMLKRPHFYPSFVTIPDITFALWVVVYYMYMYMCTCMYQLHVHLLVVKIINFVVATIKK